MTLIFVMSHQPADVSSAQSGGIIEFIAKIFLDDFELLSSAEKKAIIQEYQHLVRKAAHFLVYSALSFLLCGYFVSFEPLKKLYGFIFAFLISLIFSCSDEIHQFFVTGRSCQVSDVFLDSSGILFGIIVFLILTLLFNRIRGVSSGEKRN